MLTKNKIKLIQSLSRKKDRDETGLFLVEGNKMVEEALRSDFEIETLIGTPDFLENLENAQNLSGEIITTDPESIRKASLQKNPQSAMALIRIPENHQPKIDLTSDLILALDCIQDPGNLGTILRIADWYGIHTLVCSHDTADVYNPKVVQASMGAIFRVKTWYTSLEKFIEKSRQNKMPVYGTFMNGRNIYTEPLSKNGIIVMGNEGNGISEQTAKLIDQQITIPTFSAHANQPESLNVAIATAICCSEFRRRD